MRQAVLWLIASLSFGTAATAEVLVDELKVRGVARSGDEVAAGMRRVDEREAASRRVLGTICIGCGGPALAPGAPAARLASAAPRRPTARFVEDRAARARRTAGPAATARAGPRPAPSARVAQGGVPPRALPPRAFAAPGPRLAAHADLIGAAPRLGTYDLPWGAARYSEASNSDSARGGTWVFVRSAR